MPKLNQLYLVNNDIDKLPALLGFHKNLKQLTVEGNSLKTIRRPVIAKGTDAILTNLQDKFVEGRDDVVEAWALERAKAQEEYDMKDYGYQKENYAAAQNQNEMQNVGNTFSQIGGQFQ